jgi:hypothetical protein
MEKCDKKKIHIFADKFFQTLRYRITAPRIIFIWLKSSIIVTPLSLEQTFSWEEIVSHFQYKCNATNHNLIAIHIRPCIPHFVYQQKN